MSKEKKKDKPEEEKGKEAEMDFGMGNISLGGLGGIFEGIGSFINALSKMQEKGGISETGEIKGLGGKAKGMYGFNIRTLANGTAKVEHIGHVVKKTPKGPVVEEVREPIVDVFDEDDHILVVVELPGIEESDVKIEVKGDILTLSAERGEKKYSKEVLLPSKVDEKSLISSYKNGILEIKLERIKAGK